MPDPFSEAATGYRAPARGEAAAIERRVLKTDRAKRFTEYGRYALAITFILGLLAIIQSVRASGATLERPAYLPMESFLYPLLGLLLALNIEVIIIDLLILGATDHPFTKAVYAEDYMANARPIIFLGLLFGIILAHPAVTDTIQESLAETHTATTSGQEIFEFTPADPLALTSFDHFRVDVNGANGSVNISLYRKADLRDISSRGQPLQKFENASTATFERSLNYDEYSVFVENPTAAHIEIRYEQKRLLNLQLFRNTYLFCFAFAILNILWSVGVYAIKRRGVKQLVREEQARLARRFTIEEVFLIYKDGRLIAHNSRRLKPAMDKEILTGMLTAVQNFVRDSFQKEDEQGVLNELHYGKLKIIIENGLYANIAVTVSGDEPPETKQYLKTVLTQFHDLYGKILANWDGDISYFEQLKPVIGKLLAKEQPPATEPYEEVFLVHRDGRFITHVTRRRVPNIDDNALISLLESLQKEMKAVSTGVPPASHIIPYGNWRVVVEHGYYSYIAALISTPDSREVRQKLRRVLTDIERNLSPVLASWQGDSESLVGVKDTLEMLFVRWGLK